MNDLPISIPLSKLRVWEALTYNAISPPVRFSNPEQAAKDAEDVRTAALVQLRDELHTAIFGPDL